MKKLVFALAALFAISMFSCTGGQQENNPSDNDSIDTTVVIADTAIHEITGVAVDGANNSISLLVGAVGFISIWFVTNPYVLWLSYALIGAAWAAMLALPFTIVTNAIKGGNMGYYLGLFNCTICVPQIVAALCGGLLLKYICAHVQAGMLVVAGVLLILGACSVFLIKEK